MDWTKKIYAYPKNDDVGVKGDKHSFENIYQIFKKRLYSETYLVDRDGDIPKLEPECDHFEYGALLRPYKTKYCPDCGEKL